MERFQESSFRPYAIDRRYSARFEDASPIADARQRMASLFQLRGKDAYGDGLRESVIERAGVENLTNDRPPSRFSRDDLFGQHPLPGGNRRLRDPQGVRSPLCPHDAHDDGDDVAGRAHWIHPRPSDRREGVFFAFPIARTGGSQPPGPKEKAMFEKRQRKFGASVEGRASAPGWGRRLERKTCLS